MERRHRARDSSARALRASDARGRERASERAERSRHTMTPTPIFGRVFLGARAPTRADARLACEHGLRCGHNYPSELVGTSDCDEEAPGQRARLEGQRRRSWAIDRTRARVGRGARAYERAVKALKSWEHFDLGWARVSRESGTAVGDAVCVEARVAGVWMRNPLRIVELREREKRASGGASSSSGARAKARFAFAHGTLGGHLLAGEERFSVELAEDGEVFYEAYAFSRPAHALSVVSYPFVRLLQKRFHWDSSRAMRKILSEAE